jgi:hypothetical protein
MTTPATYDPAPALADLVTGARNQPGTGIIAREVLKGLALAEDARAAEVEQAIRAAAGRSGKTGRQRKAGIDRLYALARQSVDKSWDNPAQLLGPVLYRALLGEELLRLVAAQDETVSAADVRAMADGFWERLCADREVNGSQ